MYNRLLPILLIFAAIITTNSVAAAPIFQPSTQSTAYGKAQGLSQETVKSIVQDDQGFIWLATLDGLNRFDGVEFKVYRRLNSDESSLSNNQVNVLFSDKTGRLWVGTADGLNRYQPEYDRFERIHYQQNTKTSFEHQHITAIAEDANGLLWLATLGGLMMYDPQNGCVELFTHDDSDRDSLGTNRLRAVFVDSHNRIWVGTDGAGLDLFDRRSGKFVHFAKAPIQASLSAPKSLDSHNSPQPTILDSQLLLSSNRVTAIDEDDSGNIWVGTMDGLNRISRDLSKIERYVARADANSAVSNVIVSLAIGQSNNLYVGSIDGLSLYDPISQQFLEISHQPSVEGIRGNSIWSLYFDPQGALWLGTSQGLKKIWSAKQAIQWLKHTDEDKTGLSRSDITSLLLDSHNRLWVGTKGGGLNRTNELRHEFIHYGNQSTNENRLSEDNITALFLDSHNNVWIGTEKGLYRHDDSSDGLIGMELGKVLDGTQQHITALCEGGDGSLYVAVKDIGLVILSIADSQVLKVVKNIINPDNGSKARHINALLCRDGKVWLGTEAAGLLLIDLKNGQTNVALASKRPILTIAQDDDENIYVGTQGGGLIQLFANTEARNIYTSNNGLSDNMIQGIIFDSDGSTWLSHEQSISRITISDGKITSNITLESFDRNKFSPNAVVNDSGNMLYFGGYTGISLIKPDDFAQTMASMNVVFTELLIYNQPVDTRMKETRSAKPFVLDKSLDFLPSLTLTENENFFTIKFAATKVLEPANITFAYRLKGWDKGWIQAGVHERRVTYTNIPPGDYTLELKAMSHGYFWTHHIKRLPITIKPPFWLSWWAYGLYACILIALLVLVFYVRVEHLRAERESVINRQLKQVDVLKDEFLANISHELKTPLNGIIGLAESLLDGASGTLPNKAMNELAMIISSSKRLSNLVNDILDFSKLNNDSIELNRKAIDVMALSHVVAALCQPLVGSKELKIYNRIPQGLPAVFADEERIGQVLHNLISNAIKFTDKGHINIWAEQVDSHIVIRVEDTGIGIEAGNLDSIFMSFEQGHKGIARPYGGSGLGLAVSRQLVELHEGRLHVLSKPGVGTTFSLSLPISQNALPTCPITASNTDQQPLNLSNQTVTKLEVDRVETQTGCSFKILVVDDEPINRQVLHNHLSAENYQVVEATGGQQAIDIINAQQQKKPFDLILLDIMMPRVSGIEVCQKIRKIYSINDLPIIFLTARSQTSDLVQSFEVGANDYLSKPVAKHELLSRVKTHLKLLDINRNLEAKVEQRTQALKKSNQQNNAINEICTQISTTLDLEKLKETAYSHLKELMDVYTFCIGIYNADKQQVEFNFVIEGGEYLEPFQVSMAQSNRPAVWCVKNRQPLVINDYMRDHGKYFGDEEVPMKPMKGIKVQSLVYWPLVVSDSVIGVLSVQSHEKHAYNQQHLDMISTLASTAAIAVDNANAYFEIEQKNKALINTQEQLIQQEKMASLGTLTAGVAHEINNPTNFVHVSAQNLEVDLARVELFFIELAGEDADKAILDTFAQQFRPLHEHLSTIQDGTERIKNIVKDLRLFTQLDSEQKQTLDVAQCIESTLHLVKTKYLETVSFKTCYEGDAKIEGYPSQLNQVFMNLFVNACDAMRDRKNQDTLGEITVKCRRCTEHLEVSIADNGCGMDEVTKTKLFEPFFTTKAVGHGTGLGLSISYGIVQKHGGELSVHSQVDVGTEFTLKLPLE